MHDTERPVAVSPQREPEVHRALGELRRAEDNLAETLAALAARLEPILSPPTDDDVDGEGRRGYASDVGQTVGLVVDRLDLHAARVVALLDRVEV